MAKQPVSKGGSTKVRFIMLEAEGAEGDIAQIAAAIQSALKPSQAVIQQRIAPAARPVASISDQSEASDSAEHDDVDSDDEIVAPAPSRVLKDSKPRKYVSPKVLEVDLTTQLAFEEYANARKAENEKDRFLIVAAWFKEHREETAIGVNHVYTCYKKMRWPSAISDFAWPFRSLKKDGLMDSGGRGLYAINHIGVGRADELEKD
jgi:hypothetical protein